MRKKIIRIFISSTFVDMSTERNILQQDVLPPIKEYCLSKGWQFESIDLRWGISNEASDEHRTVQICLEEIRDCQKISPRPNFFIMLGERYGWQPLPETISDRTMQNIVNIATNREKKILNYWYKKDFNGIPPEYILQPLIINPRRNYNKDEICLRELICRYINLDNTSISNSLNSSATETEIEYGLFKLKDSFSHVGAYIRQLNNIPLSQQNTYQDQGLAAQRLCILKKRIKKILKPQNIYESNEEFQNISSNEYKQKFIEISTNIILRLVNEEITNYVNITDWQIELSVQEEFKEINSIFFRGRELTMSKVHFFLNNNSEDNILYIRGESGNGKSALLSHISHIIPHNILFSIGISPQSSDGISILQLMAYKLGIGKIEKYETLVEMIKRTIELKCKQLFLICLDAIDQLPKNDKLLDWDWLPFPRPNNLKVIISSTPEVNINIPHLAINLGPLDANEGIPILLERIKQKGRKLTKLQAQILQKAFLNAACKPIFFKFAERQILQWHSYDTPKEFANNLSFMIQDYYRVLALPQNHGETLVVMVLTLLSYTHHGITYDEILTIVASNSNYYCNLQSNHIIPPTSTPAIPPILWIKLFQDLQPFLSINKSIGGVTYRFYHNIMKQAAILFIEQYFDIKNQTINLMRLYFNSKWQKGNLRSLDESPYLTIQHGSAQDIMQLLCNSLFIQKKCAASLTNELIYDFEMALTTSIISENPTIERNISIFAKYIKKRKSYLYKYCKLSDSFLCNDILNNETNIFLRNAVNSYLNLPLEDNKDVKSHSIIEIEGTFLSSSINNIQITSDFNYIVTASYNTDEEVILSWIDTPSFIIKKQTFISLPNKIGKSIRSPQIKKLIISPDNTSVLFYDDYFEHIFYWNITVNKVVEIDSTIYKKYTQFTIEDACFIKPKQICIVASLYNIEKDISQRTVLIVDISQNQQVTNIFISHSYLDDVIVHHSPKFNELLVLSNRELYKITPNIFTSSLYTNNNIYTDRLTYITTDHKFIYSISEDNKTIYQYNIDKKESLKHEYPLLQSYEIFSYFYIDENHHLFIGCTYKSIIIYDIINKQEIGSISNHDTNTIRFMAYNPVAKQIYLLNKNNINFFSINI